MLKGLDNLHIMRKIYIFEKTYKLPLEGFFKSKQNVYLKALFSLLIIYRKYGKRKNVISQICFDFCFSCPACS